MLKAIEVRAPKLRNQAVMRMWFDTWNEDNRRAREAYDDRMAHLEAQVIVAPDPYPRMCSRKRHVLSGPEDVRDGRCRGCRNARDRERRRGVPGRRGGPRKLTAEQEAQIAALYLQDKMSLTSLGQQFGVSHVGIRKILLRNAVPLRTPSESALLKRKKDV